MTVLIMTLNNNNQLFDVLDKLSPQANDPNVQIYRGNDCYSFKGNMNQTQSPSKIKDSLTLNTQRLNAVNEEKNTLNSTTNKKAHNRSNFQNLNNKNRKEKSQINPQKVNLHNLKKLNKNFHLNNLKVVSPLERRVTPTQRNKSDKPTNRFRSVKANRVKGSRDSSSRIRDSQGT